MMFWRKLGLSDGAAAALVALFVIFGAGAWAVWNGQVPPSDEAEPQTAAVQQLQEAVPVVEDTPVPVQSSEPQAPATETVEEAAPTAPALDLVRVSPEGDAVIAGTADPGVAVVFLVNGEEMARATADGSGSFVGLFSIPSSDQPNAITVAVEGEDGALTSDESVLVAAIAAKAVPDVAVVETPDAPETPQVVEPATNEPANNESDIEVAAAEDQPASNAPETVTTPELDDATSEANPEVAEAATVGVQPKIETPVVEIPVVVQDDVAAIASNVGAGESAASEPLATARNDDTAPRDAPAIVVAGSSGIKLLQPAQQPDAPTAAATSNVVIDTITYDAVGEVALVGRGRGEGFVRVYLNDKPILTVPVDPDGSWATPLADVDAGVYQLRIDEISAQGDVTSRVETPFQREEVELAADAAPTAITVQPGSTLWAIARDRFGEGTEYVRVYNANRDLIRDPDLIYPGQVFALPDE